MTPSETKKRVVAVQKLFSESSSTIEKLKSVRTLLQGMNPRIDEILGRYETHLDMLENVEEETYIQLSAETLPENTEEEKKRKAALLLFLKSWHDLKEEVARVSAEMETAQTTGASSASLLGKIFKSAKGPLAIITVVAIGIATLQVTAVDIEIKNTGCGTLMAESTIPPVPGFALPQKNIPSGESATATLPPFSFDVDGTNKSALTLSAITFNFSFNLGNRVQDVLFNGVSIIGTKTTINLRDAKKHTIEVVCR